jgi:hypothetical protein
MAQAAIIPFFEFVGGGSALTGAVLTGAAAATVGAGVIAADQARAAGRIAEAQAEIDAAAEGDAGREREIQRKKLLMRAISSQIAQAGAAGIAFEEGSPAQLAQLDIDEAGRDTEIDTANVSARQRGLRSQGRAARVTSRTQSNITLLDTAARAATILG